MNETFNETYTSKTSEAASGVATVKELTIWTFKYKWSKNPIS